MVYLFEKYRLDEENFSLTKEGQRIPVEPKALRVLLVLVAAEGRLLEKKALLEAVWKDTFVEETTLTRAIALLRKHLADNPRSPTYIETVPTLGYRFIAPVEILEPFGETVSPESAPSPIAPESPISTPAANPDEPDPLLTPPHASQPADEIPAPTPASPHRHFVYRPVYIVGVAAAILVALLIGVILKRRASPKLNAKDTIILADFANTSGDPLFDDTLRQGMVVQLEQSPLLHLASESTIRKTLRLMGKDSSTPLTPELSHEICQRIGAAAVLDGSISRAGTEYVLGLRAKDCLSGDLLDIEQVQVKRKEDVLEALTNLAAEFRSKVGESVASVNRLDTPLAEATTPSLDALKAFSQGIKLFNSTGSAQALPLFLHATELDPNFAIAHVWLGRMYADFNEETLSAESTRRAYQLRDHASDRERFAIDTSYDLLVSGNIIKARETCGAWIQMYPADPFPHAFLSGVIYPAFGDYEKALDESRQTIKVDPDFVVGYRNLASNAIALNRLQIAESALQLAAERKLFLAGFVTDKYRIAYLKADANGMKQALSLAPNNPWLLSYEALTRARAGDLEAARAISARSVNLARQSARPDVQSKLQVASSLLQASYGDPRTAKQLALQALSLSTTKTTQFEVAYVLAMTGDLQQASRLAKDLATRFPEDTIVQTNYVPQLRALLALNQHQPQKAIDLLQAAEPYDLSLPLYAIYIRGKAYSELGDAAKAATEFKKILDHPGLVLNDPVSQLATVELAKAHAQLTSGRTSLTASTHTP